MAEFRSEIRGVLIALSQSKVVLPNASVAEVITYSSPREFADAPPWALGLLTWRGWRIPLFSLSMMAGAVSAENLAGAKVAVVKALGGSPKLPFMAMLTQGFPRLTTLTPDNVALVDQENEPAPGIACVVSVNEDRAYLPDLDAIESMLIPILDADAEAA